MQQKIPEQKTEIEIMESYVYSPFSLKGFGVTPDPTKDYRWVAPDRVEERKHNDGFSFVPGKSPDGTVRTRGNMVLMFRSKDRQREAELRQRVRTLEQTASSREAFEQEVEKLCYKYDQDLHKNASKGSGDN